MYMEALNMIKETIGETRKEDMEKLMELKN